MLNYLIPTSSNLRILGTITFITFCVISLPIGCGLDKGVDLDEEESTHANVLSESQKIYMQWTNESFTKFLDQSKYYSLPDNKKSELEAKWLKALQNLDTNESYEAINCLTTIKSEKAINPLLNIALDRIEKNNRGRWMATRALGIIDDESVTPNLIPLLYHYNQNTRFWAQISLVRLNGVNFASDWKKWGRWWNMRGGDPPFLAQKVQWTSNSNWSNEKNQRETDKRAIENLKNMACAKVARISLRKMFNTRMQKDSEIYTELELQEINTLYRDRGPSKNWNSPETKENLKKLIASYKKANRAGCATLYLALLSSGEERENYLRTAIDKYSDCWYGDGVQVGAFARFHLALLYQQIGKRTEADKLFKELLTNYPNAIDHQGRLLENSIPKL